MNASLFAIPINLGQKAQPTDALLNRFGRTTPVTQMGGDTTSFVDLLGLLQQSANDVTAVNSQPKDGEESTPLDPFAQLLSQTSGVNGFAIDPAIAIMKGMTLPVTQINELQSKLDSDALADKISRVIAHHTEAQLALPTFGSASRVRPNELMSEQSDVEGKFIVKKTEFQGDKVVLTAINLDTPDRPVTITLPASVLMSTDQVPAKDILARGVTSREVQRVSVMPQAQTPQMTKLMADLRVHEITIEPVQLVTTNPATPEYTVTIHAIAQQEPQLVSTVLPRSDIRIAKRETVSAAIIPTKPSGSSVPAESGLVVESADQFELPGQRFSDHAIPEHEGNASEEFISLEFEKPEEKLDLRSPSDAEGTLLKSTDYQPNVAVKPVQVKFTLPEKLETPLANRSQSITLKLDPEHLGPATLHLAVSNDVISARLTVDSSHAKAAVESSLDNLTQQLNRAGIKVDFIEVGLRGGTAYNQQQHRQPEWQQARRPMMRILEEPLAAVTAAVSHSVTGSYGYLTPSTVNLFA